MKRQKNPRSKKSGVAKQKPRTHQTKKNRATHEKSTIAFQSFEENFEKTINEKTNANIEAALVKMFKTPFTPSKITPQNDFYTYINYRWLKNTSVSVDKDKKFKDYYFVQVDDFRVTQDKVFKELIEMVKEYIRTDHSKQAKEVKRVYQSMTLEHSTTHLHVENLKKSYDHFINEDNLWEYLAHININEVVCWGSPLYWHVSADDKNAGIYRNFVSMPRLSLYDYELYITDGYGKTKEYITYRNKVQKRYLEYIDEIFDACLGKNHDLSAQDVFDCEYDMLTQMGCESVKKDSPEYYNIVKKEDALKEYGFDWAAFTKFLGFKNPPDFFISDSLSYLKCISTLLLKEWKTQKWKSYWFYLYLRQFIRFDKKLMNIYYEFNGKFLLGQPNMFPLEIYPIFGLSLTFNTLLTNMYVEKNHNPEIVQYVLNMGADLITVFKRIIRRNKWLSPKTKQYALLKLEHLKLEVVQPTNLREDPLLDYSSDDAWENIQKIVKWRTYKFVNLDGKSVRDIPIIDWNIFKLIGTQAYVVNAYYTPTQNKIYIPLAYLQSPFIDLNERGIEYNLARVGNTLAHEMSHSLDEMGSKYDYKGNLHDWWTPEDKRKYKAIIKDIIKQYEVFAKYDGINFDATMSIGEDMADISAVAICEEYLRDFQIKNDDITPIRSLSFQAFFVYFAVQQRQHVFKKAVEAQLKTNPHPMDKYRTNVPLSRLELFRSLYNIQKGDKMWWHSASTIW